MSLCEIAAPRFKTMYVYLCVVEAGCAGAPGTGKATADSGRVSQEGRLVLSRTSLVSPAVEEVFCSTALSTSVGAGL
jgi:hypothetical protein